MLVVIQVLVLNVQIITILYQSVHSLITDHVLHVAMVVLLVLDLDKMNVQLVLLLLILHLTIS